MNDTTAHNIRTAAKTATKLLVFFISKQTPNIPVSSATMVIPSVCIVVTHAFCVLFSHFVGGGYNVAALSSKKPFAVLCPARYAARRFHAKHYLLWAKQSKFFNLCNCHCTNSLVTINYSCHIPLHPHT